jgi:hypothetical protein
MGVAFGRAVHSYAHGALGAKPVSIPIPNAADARAGRPLILFHVCVKHMKQVKQDFDLMN